MSHRRVLPLVLAALSCIWVPRAAHAAVVAQATPVTRAAPSDTMGGATVRGRILDGSDDRPIEAGLVHVRDTRLQVQSDQRGYYELRNVPPGEHRLVVRRLGYQADSAMLRLRGNEMATHDFSLYRAFLHLENICAPCPPRPTLYLRVVLPPRSVPPSRWVVYRDSAGRRDSIVISRPLFRDGSVDLPFSQWPRPLGRVEVAVPGFMTWRSPVDSATGDPVPNWTVQLAALRSETDSIRRETTARMEEMLAAWRRKDIAGMTAVFAEDATLIGPQALHAHGRYVIEQYWRSRRRSDSWEIETLEVGGSLDSPWQYARSIRVTTVNGKREETITTFIVVWKRGSDGKLRIYLDLFT